MIYVFMSISCVIFIELFIFFDLKNAGMNLVTQSRKAMSVVMSSKLNDDAKEAFLRRASFEMLKSTFVFAMKFLLITAVLYAMYWLLVTIAPELRVPILESVVSPVVIIGVTVGAMTYAWVRNVVLK